MSDASSAGAASGGHSGGASHAASSGPSSGPSSGHSPQGDSDEHHLVSIDGGPSTYEGPPKTHRVLLYSDDPEVRGTVRTAIGRRPAPDLARIDWVEVGNGPSVVQTVDAGGLDLAILDGEAWPTGGLGLCKQLKDEVRDCPPVLVLIARRDDAWLATWSLADAVVPLPIDPPELTAAAVGQLRRREAAAPVRRAVR